MITCQVILPALISTDCLVFAFYLVGCPDGKGKNAQRIVQRNSADSCVKLACNGQIKLELIKLKLLIRLVDEPELLQNVRDKYADTTIFHR